MNINKVDSNNNQVQASKENSKQQSSSLDIANEFSKLIGQFISGADLNGVSDALDQVARSVVDIKVAEPKVKEDKKEIKKVEENNNNEQSLEVKKDEDVEEKSDSKKSDQGKEQEKDENQVDEVVLKNEVVRSLDTSLKIHHINAEFKENPIEESDKEQVAEEMPINEQQLNQNSNNKKLAHNSSENVDNSFNQANDFKDQLQDSPVAKGVSVKNLKKVSSQEEQELSQISSNQGQDKEEIGVDGSAAFGKKLDSLFAAANKEVNVNVAAQLQKAANSPEALAAKSGAKNSINIANDVSGVGVASNSAEKFNFNKVRQTAANLLPKYSEKTLEKVKELLQKATQNRDGNNSLTLKLDPQELGQITVKVTQRDNNVYARIIPESPEVESMLRQKSAELTQVLNQAGIKTEQIHISFGQERSEADTYRFNDFMDGQYSSRQEGQFSAKSGNERAESRELNTAFNKDVKPSMIDAGWVA